MLTEERYSLILERVSRQGSVRLTELCEMLEASESTVRRDLNALAKKGLLVKVHGGAIAAEDSFNYEERNVAEKSLLFIEEKNAIAKYAASLVEDGDFIFIDAGTTTERMIEFLEKADITVVTSSFVHAKRLAQRGFRVFIPAGEIKVTTEAIVGAECVLSLMGYNFTKCFIGVNGISFTGGMSTPDKNEAAVKSAVIRNSRKTYFLADHSKFDKATSARFAEMNNGVIITDRLDNKKYNNYTSVKEVLI